MSGGIDINIEIAENLNIIAIRSVLSELVNKIQK